MPRHVTSAIGALADAEYVNVIGDAMTGALAITESTTANALSIDQNGNVGTNVSTDGALHIENTGNTGIGLGVYSNIGAAAAELVSIKANNTAFDKSVLLITDSATTAHETITLNSSMAGAQNVIDISVSGAFSTGAVLKARATNANATGQGITIENEGTGIGLFVDDNNSGIATSIDHDVTNKNVLNSSLLVDYKSTVNDAGTYTRTGSIASITAGVIETSGTITDSAIVLDINQTHADATGNVVDIDNDGAGRALQISADGIPAATLGGIVQISGNSDHTTSANTNLVRIYSNVAHAASVSNGKLLHVVNDNANSLCQAFGVIQDGVGAVAVDIDHNGAGRVINANSDYSNQSNNVIRYNLSETVAISDGGTYARSGTYFLVSVSENITSGINTDSIDVCTIRNLSTSNSSGNLVYLNQDGSGKALFIDHDDTSTNPSVDIDRDGNNAAKIWGMKIDVDNAGAGSVGGIDFSAMAIDEALFKGTSDAITNAGTVSHQLPVDIGGTIFYLVAYTHGS